MNKLPKIKLTLALILAVVLLLTVTLVVFGRPIMSAFDLSQENVEASMGGYITSMLGAILGTLLALIGAVVVQEQQEKREDMKKQKSDARILYYDILASLNYAKLKRLQSHLSQEKLSEFETLVHNKLGMSKIAPDFELLTKERRAEIISSLERLSPDEQTYLIQFISAVDYSSRLSDSLYATGIEKKYKNFVKELSLQYSQYSSQKNYSLFDVYSRLNEATGTDQLSVAIVTHLDEEIEEFLGACTTIPQEVRRYIKQQFSYLFTAESSEAFDDTQNHYRASCVELADDGRITGFDKYDAVDSDYVTDCIEKLLVLYDKYLLSAKESIQQRPKKRLAKLLKEYKAADVLKIGFLEIELACLSELGINVQTPTDAVEVICNSYMETGDHIIAYRMAMPPTSALCDYFDCEVANRLYPDIRRHLAFLQEAYMLRFESFPALREYVYNIDLENDLPDRMKTFRVCLEKLEKIAGVTA